LGTFVPQVRLCLGDLRCVSGTECDDGALVRKSVDYRSTNAFGSTRDDYSLAGEKEIHGISLYPAQAVVRHRLAFKLFSSYLPLWSAR
jgi:hypothetical protein